MINRIKNNHKIGSSPLRPLELQQKENLPLIKYPPNYPANTTPNHSSVHDKHKQKETASIEHSHKKIEYNINRSLPETSIWTPIERELRCTAATIPTKKLSSEPTSRKAKSISVEDALPSWLLRAARCRCYRVVFLRASVHQKDRICLTTRNTNLTRSTHRSCRSCNYPPQLSPNTTKPSSPSPISPLNTQTKSISPLPSTIASSK